MSAEPAENERNSDPAEMMEALQFLEVLKEKYSQPLASDVALWSPAQDPDNPSPLYLPGFNVAIRAHNISETEQPRQNLKPEYLRTVTHSEAVVNNPSRFSCSGSDDAGLTGLAITAPISIGTTRGAQVVACTITPRQKDRQDFPKPFQAVAKIYDPLYYSFKHSIGRYPRDTVRQADKDYENETGAYERLRKHGLTGPDRSAGADSFHYPEEYRLEVLARAMDGYVKQLKIGLGQGDFTGRNVVLVANTSGEDKAGAEVVEMAREQADWLPCNLAAVFWNEYLWQDFGGWVPNEWQDGEVQED